MTTARVIDLSARLERNQPPTVPACGCPVHLLDALAERVRGRLDVLAGKLLWPEQSDLLTDVVTTITAALDAVEEGAQP